MRKINIAALMVVGLGATACTASGPSGEPVRDLDARGYHDRYDSSRDDKTASVGGAPLPSTVDSSEASGDPGLTVAPHPPEPPGGGIFRDEGPSLWVDAALEQASTFALDVDTASFSIARTYLSQGVTPEPASIRAEEWVNSFSYGDTAPTDTALGVHVESALAPRGGTDTALVRIGVSTEEISAEERPAANITFVIDTSGSMNASNRLGLVQSSLALLAENLRADDTIAIVTYGTDAAPLLPPTPVAEVDTIVAAIEDLTPGGSTNMEAGLILGYQQARQSYVEDGVNVVVLASDGVANVGATDAEVINEITEAGQDGINLVTVGYGMGTYNDVLMEQLANTGNGFYSYIDTFEEAERLFVDELTPTLTVVAYDSKAQVIFDTDLVARYRLIGYENRRLDTEDFKDDTVDAGELGAGHSVTALYEIEPVSALEPGTVIGQVGLRWADAPGGMVEQLDAEIRWPNGESSDAIQLAALVADTAEVLKGTPIAQERELTLAGLRETASDLTDRQVTGAREVLEFIATAQEITAD